MRRPLPPSRPPPHGRARKNIRGEVGVASDANQLVPDTSGNVFGAWSIVDADLALMLHRLVKNNDDVPEKLRIYAEGQWVRASVNEFVKHARPTFVPYTYT